MSFQKKATRVAGIILLIAKKNYPIKIPNLIKKKYLKQDQLTCMVIH